MNRASWDHGTHADFYAYYAAASESPETITRFRSIRAAVLRVAAGMGLPKKLQVADIGCGAGTQARLWAELGHSVLGLDVNEPLILLARERAEARDLNISFEVGSATALPWSDATVHVCLMPELLEHVEDWKTCLTEAARVLRSGGLLYLSTTNVLCPLQQEFSLPIYSWYPRSLKRFCERLAITSHPQLANYAKYPAVHWFSLYSLRDFLLRLGFRSCLDRFDLIDLSNKNLPIRSLVLALRFVPALRFLGHVATPATYLVAVKT